ncbi:MAG: hypothetical protein JEZ14_24915 [Marinilabiliaceae bacterium]|nr:hypothetical protein [Marinilabiliaceae bacterium]
MNKLIQIIFFIALFFFSIHVLAWDEEIRSFSIEDGLPNNAISSIVEDSLGVIWYRRWNCAI